MTRYSLDCPTALVIFKITHQDRAGETGTTIQREGEIVTMNQEGQAVIAAESGDIILCPSDALRPRAEIKAGESVAHDFIAAVELVRWIPAKEVPFTMNWMRSEEISQLIRELTA